MALESSTQLLFVGELCVDCAVGCAKRSPTDARPDSREARVREQDFTLQAWRAATRKHRVPQFAACQSAREVNEYLALFRRLPSVGTNLREALVVGYGLGIGGLPGAARRAARAITPGESTTDSDRCRW